MLAISGIVVASLVSTQLSNKKSLFYPDLERDRILLSKMNDTLLSRINNEIRKMENHIQSMNDLVCQIEFELSRTNTNSNFLTLKLQSINEGIKTAQSILDKNYTWKQRLTDVKKIP